MPRMSSTAMSWPRLSSAVRAAATASSRLRSRRSSVMGDASAMVAFNSGFLAGIGQISDQFYLRMQRSTRGWIRADCDGGLPAYNATPADLYLHLRAQFGAAMADWI